MLALLALFALSSMTMALGGKPRFLHFGLGKQLSSPHMELTAHPIACHLSATFGEARQSAELHFQEKTNSRREPSLEPWRLLVR